MEDPSCQDIPVNIFNAFSRLRRRQEADGIAGIAGIADLTGIAGLTDLADRKTFQKNELTIYMLIAIIIHIRKF
jgi:hypothetical protein